MAIDRLIFDFREYMGFTYTVESVFGSAEVWVTLFYDVDDSTVWQCFRSYPSLVDEQVAREVCEFTGYMP